MELENLLDWIGTHVTRFTQSSVRIRALDGTVVDFDPSGISPEQGPSDLVLVTHDHGDHLNPRAIKALLKSGTQVVVPTSVRTAGGDRGLATDSLAPGETKVFGAITVTAVPAYNLKAPMHSQDKGYVGYTITVDGVKLYHAGDTDWIPEMTGLGPDIAFLPVGGLVTMNPVQAAAAAEVLGARVVIPIHYGLIPFTGGAGRRFARLWSGVTEILVPGSGAEDRKNR